jgi:hypothetical protein
MATPSVATDHSNQRGTRRPLAFGELSSHPAPATSVQPAIVPALALNCSSARLITTSFTMQVVPSPGALHWQ